MHILLACFLVAIALVSPAKAESPTSDLMYSGMHGFLVGEFGEVYEIHVSMYTRYHRYNIDLVGPYDAENVGLTQEAVSEFEAFIAATATDGYVYQYTFEINNESNAQIQLLCSTGDERVLALFGHSTTGPSTIEIGETASVSMLSAGQPLSGITPCEILFWNDSLERWEKVVNKADAPIFVPPTGSPLYTKPIVLG
jgi:hypothetical protein